jgi:hypothetical protein
VAAGDPAGTSVADRGVPVRTTSPISAARTTPRMSGPLMSAQCVFNGNA